MLYSAGVVWFYFSPWESRQSTDRRPAGKWLDFSICIFFFNKKEGSPDSPPRSYEREHCLLPAGGSEMKNSQRRNGRWRNVILLPADILLLHAVSLRGRLALYGNLHSRLSCCSPLTASLILLSTLFPSSLETVLPVLRIVMCLVCQQPLILA